MPRPKKPSLEVECKQCGILFHTTSQRVGKNKMGNFCSNACYVTWKKANKYSPPPKKKADPANLKTFTCSQCDKEFQREVYNLKKGQKYGPFCSHECYGKWRSGNLAGKNSPAWKGGYNYEYGGSHWKSQRRKARERDNHTCQDCGVTEQAHGYKLDVHHLIPYDMFEDSEEANDLSNLLTLCRPCHVKRHKELDRETLEKLLSVESD